MRTVDLDDVFAQAAELLELDLCSGRQSAMPLEPRAGFTAYDRATGRVTLTASVQMPLMLRTGIADTLGMPEAILRVVTPDVGGGFRQKMPLFPKYAASVWAAFRLRRFLVWMDDQRENFLVFAHSCDQVVTFKSAFDAAGRLLGIDVDLRSNVGAYSCYLVNYGVEPLMAFAELAGPHDFAQYGLRSRGMTTNICMVAPYGEVLTGLDVGVVSPAKIAVSVFGGVVGALRRKPPRTEAAVIALAAAP